MAHSDSLKKARKLQADLEEVRRKIAVGIEQLDRGEGFDGEQVFDELLADPNPDGGQPVIDPAR